MRKHFKKVVIMLVLVLAMAQVVCAADKLAGLYKRLESDIKAVHGKQPHAEIADLVAISRQYARAGNHRKASRMIILTWQLMLAQAYDNPTDNVVFLSQECGYIAGQQAERAGRYIDARSLYNIVGQPKQPFEVENASLKERYDAIRKKCLVRRNLIDVAIRKAAAKKK